MTGPHDAAATPSAHADDARPGCLRQGGAFVGGFIGFYLVLLVGSGFVGYVTAAVRLRSPWQLVVGLAVLAALVVAGAAHARRTRPRHRALVAAAAAGVGTAAVLFGGCLAVLLRMGPVR